MFHQIKANKRWLYADVTHTFDLQIVELNIEEYGLSTPKMNCFCFDKFVVKKRIYS